MINRDTNKLIVLAFCITNSFCFGQQNQPAVCRLGEITNDSLLPFIQSLEVDCDKDLTSYIKKSNKFTSLQQLELKGDAGNKQWENLFGKLKTQPGLKTVVFADNTFTALPYGYEGLYTVENLSFKNNEELDYAILIDQLAALPNIKELNLEVVTIFELPKNLVGLKNIETIRIVNADEMISKNQSPFAVPKHDPVTFDYYLDKGNGASVKVKYTAMAGEIDSDEYKELAKRFTTTANFETGAMAFTPKYVNVNPPIAGIDVERTVYKINPQIENILTYASGTKIRIPANAFTDAAGNAVTTSVSLGYREFRDPVDFLVSGIPMKYDTANEVTNFESAGMFELTASSNNEALNVAKDKRIDMNFVTTSNDSTYNFYGFNDSSGNWEYLEKPKTVTAATIIKPYIVSKAMANFQYYSSANTRVYDSTTFDKRFSSTEHVYTFAKNAVGSKGIEYFADGKQRFKTAEKLIRINNVRRTKEGDVLFKLSCMPNAHPEMNDFNNVYFELGQNMSANEFKKKYARKKFYNDIRIYANGGDVNIKLKDENSIKDLSASVVSMDDKGKIKKINNLNARVKHYNRSLKTRERTFDRKLKKGKTNGNEMLITDPEERRAYAYQKAKKDMSADELKMSYDEWMDYCKQTELNRIAALKKMNSDLLAQTGNSEANASNLVQNLSLSGTGIYNCDQIQRLKNPVELFAHYETPEGKKLNASSAYIIDKATNSVFQYDGHYGFSAHKIAFSKSASAQNTLLAIDPEGGIAIYRTEEFKKNQFKNKSDFDFVVTKINSNFTTVNELKALIGF